MAKREYTHRFAFYDATHPNKISLYPLTLCSNWKEGNRAYNTLFNAQNPKYHTPPQITPLNFLKPNQLHPIRKTQNKTPITSTKTPTSNPTTPTNPNFSTPPKT